MTDPTNERAEQERRRWTRENAHLYVRPDAARFLCPDAPRFLRPDTKGWRHPDDKLFNPYFRYREPDAEVSERSTARHSRLCAHGTSEAPRAVPPASQVLRLKSELAGLRRQLAGIRQEIAARHAGGLPSLRESDPRRQRFLGRYRGFQQLCRKAGFDENQPRVPAGNPDGGQWSDSGGAGGSTSGGITDRRILSDATPDNNWKPGARYAQDRSRRYSVILEDEEARGGHAISKHVGKTDDDLVEVLRKNYHVGLTTYNFQDAEGSFTDVRSANYFVNRTLRENQAIVDLVASGQSNKEMIEHRFDYPTGMEAYRASVDSEPYVRSTYAVRVVIRHDTLSERGYSVITAFPINKLRKERAP